MKIRMVLCCIGVVIAVWLSFAAVGRIFLNRQLKCLDRAQEGEIQLTVRKAFKDTINVWIERRVRTVQRFLICDWKVDALLMNAEQTRGLVLVVSIDGSSSAVFDDIRFFAAEYRNGKWDFYSAGLPTVLVPRDGIFANKHTLDELGVQGREEAIKGGYYKGWSCEINDEYINAWFVPYLYKGHLKFLRDTILD